MKTKIKKGYYNDRELIEKRPWWKGGGIYKDNFVEVKVLGRRHIFTNTYSWYELLVELPNGEKFEVSEESIFERL